MSETETDGAVTPATDETVEALRWKGDKPPLLLSQRLDHSLVLRIAAERERAERAEADVAALREAFHSFVYYDEAEFNAENDGQACRYCRHTPVMEHHGDCPARILAQPNPAEGRVLVDAARLYALEHCAEIAAAVYEVSTKEMNAGALGHALCDLGDAVDALAALEGKP